MVWERLRLHAARDLQHIIGRRVGPDGTQPTRYHIRTLINPYQKTNNDEKTRKRTSEFECVYACVYELRTGEQGLPLSCCQLDVGSDHNNILMTGGKDGKHSLLEDEEFIYYICSSSMI